MAVFLEMLFGLRGIKIALFLSMFFAALFAAFFFYANNLLADSILFLFMFESYRAWRSSLSLSEHDQNSDLQTLLRKGEEAYRAGNIPAALENFRTIQEKVVFRNPLHQSRPSHPANISAQQNEEAEALNLLLPLQKKLPPGGRLLLLRLLYIRAATTRRPSPLATSFFRNRLAMMWPSTMPSAMPTSKTPKQPSAGSNRPSAKVCPT